MAFQLQRQRLKSQLIVPSTQVHEQLQALRGNIRVLCRVRPGVSGEAQAIECPLPGELVVTAPDRRPQTFEFPAVFAPVATQVSQCKLLILLCMCSCMCMHAAA